MHGVVRQFRHGIAKQTPYWVEIWEGKDRPPVVQRISIRGVGEFREPLRDVRGPGGSIDVLLAHAKLFVEECLRRAPST